MLGSSWLIPDWLPEWVVVVLYWASMGLLIGATLWVLVSMRGVRRDTTQVVDFVDWSHGNLHKRMDAAGIPGAHVTYGEFVANGGPPTADQMLAQADTGPIALPTVDASSTLVASHAQASDAALAQLRHVLGVGPLDPSTVEAAIVTGSAEPAAPAPAAGPTTAPIVAPLPPEDLPTAAQVGGPGTGLDYRPHPSPRPPRTGATAVGSTGGRHRAPGED
jgi:hypothetical protein